jgi:NAD(P)-dependent dehydrogenase (short-subunit alcohol dehydrogenase family)
MIKGFGRKSEGIKADIRDIFALRRIADDIERRYGKIDIVVANAAIQRWMPHLEMEDADWFDVIDNNLNGTANTVRAFAPKMVARNKGRFVLLALSVVSRENAQKLEARRSSAAVGESA